MRSTSMTKMRSEPNIFGGMKGNKPFAPIKRSSVTGPSSSYKLSSKVKNILSNDLNKTPSYGGCGDDSSIQSTNTRRRFQRRGSKSASMFKALSADHFNIPGSLFENILQKQPASPNNTNAMFLKAVVEIQKDSQRSCMSGFEDSSTSFDMETSEEFGCASYNA